MVLNGVGERERAMYKLDALHFFKPDEAHPDRHVSLPSGRRIIYLDGDIDAQVDALPDLDNDERAALKVEVREGWTQLQARSEFEIADYVPPAPTALEVWEQEMLRLNKVIRDDYRYWEESAAGEISPTAATRMAAQVAAAKAHRDLRPQGEA